MSMFHARWLKWSDFHGEQIMMRGIRPCAESAECRNVQPSSIDQIAILLPISAEDLSENGPESTEIH